MFVMLTQSLSRLFRESISEMSVDTAAIPTKLIGKSRDSLQHGSLALNNNILKRSFVPQDDRHPVHKLAFEYRQALQGSVNSS